MYIMSHESNPNPEEFLTAANEAEHIRETNKLQFDLIQRMYGEVNDENLTDWDGKFSEAFRNALHAEIRNNPHLLRDYMSADSRDGVLEMLELSLRKYAHEETPDNIIDFYEEKLDKAA